MLSDLPDKWFTGASLNPYLRYPWPKTEAVALYKAECTNEGLIFASDQGNFQAALVYRFLPWDSEILGFPIARLGSFLGEPTAYPELLGKAIKKARSDGVRLLMAKLVEEESAKTILTSSGFSIRARTHRFLLGPRNAEWFRRAPKRHRTRRFQKKDVDEVRRLAASTLAVAPSHLKGAPGLPESSHQQVYARWVEETLSALIKETRESDHGMRVSFDGADNLTGFLTWRVDTLARQCLGRWVAGRGLSGVLPSARGAYIDLIRDSMLENERSRGSDFLGCFDVDERNEAALKVLQRMGLELATTFQTYHLPLEQR